MPDRENLSPARVFLALWPNDDVRGQLAAEGVRLHKALSGKLTRSESIHLTLVFIGDLPRNQLPELLSAMKGVSGTAFEVVFDQVDCWRHNRIAFLTATQPTQGLMDLVSKLEAELDRMGLEFDHRPYKPHITLIRKAMCEKRNPAPGRVPVSPEWGDFAPIKWSADNFVLVESARSSEGSAYRILGRFPLS
jgi:2'-5' RNA ligase